MLPPMRVVLALALLGVGDAASPEVDPALWQEYYQQGTTHNLPSEAGYVSFLYGTGFSFGGPSSTGQITLGVGGSAGSCTRQYAVPVYFVPVTSSLASAEAVTFTLDVIDDSSQRSNAVDLYGLGLRELPVVNESDWYTGATGEDPDATLLKAGFALDGVTGPFPSADVGAYLSSLYDEWAALGTTAVYYAAFRINFPDDFGCTEACDGGCSIRRIYSDATNSTFKATFGGDKVGADGFVTEDHQSTLLTASCGDGDVVALDYNADEAGNVIPDFSTVGYHYGADLPLDTAATFTVNPSATVEDCIETFDDDAGYGYVCDADDTAAIQAAVDAVSAMDLDEAGIRGTVMLAPGTFFVGGTVSVMASGVILKGAGEDETTIWATHETYGQNTFEAGVGSSARPSESNRVAITDAYAPLGATTVHCDSSGFAVGDSVVVEWAPTDAWIASIGMDAIPNCESVDFRDDPLCYDWVASGYLEAWEREVVEVLDDGVVLDVALVHPMDAALGDSSLYVQTWTNGGRLSEIGFADFTIKSIYDQAGGTLEEEGEEDHAYIFIKMDYVEHSWVSDVSCWHFVFACVQSNTWAKFTTVQRSSAYDPVSVITGGRRYSFSLEGQLTLWANNYARRGRHDYVTGGVVLGPNVWVDCTAEHAYEDIGPHMRYATGQLYDRVVGGQMRAWDRGNMGSGHGWSGAEIMFWNAYIFSSGHSENLVIQSPPGAKNYAIGAVIDQAAPVVVSYDGWEVGPTVEPGVVESLQMHVFPSSLYAAQKSARLGEPYFECVAAETAAPTTGEVEMASVAVDVEYDSVYFRYGTGTMVRSSSTTSMIGVGGSSSSCTRSVMEPVYVIEMSEAYAYVEDAFFSVLVTDDAKMYDDVFVDLYGLGLRDAKDATVDDFHIGADPDNTLLAVELLGEDTEETSYAVNIGAYVKAQYAEYVASGETETKFLAFRLTLGDDFGCFDACDAGCSIRRVQTGRDATTITITYPESEADAVSSLSDGHVGSASTNVLAIVAIVVLGLLLSLVVAYQLYRAKWKRETIAARVEKPEMGDEKAGPAGDML